MRRLWFLLLLPVLPLLLGTNYLEQGGTYSAVSSGASAANPTGTVGLSAVNGSASTFLRSDGAPALDQSIAPTWTGVHQFTDGKLQLKGSSSGTTTLKAAATAGTTTLTFPGATTDFSATGGTSQVVKQTSSGGAFSVARLACADLSDAGSGCTGSSGSAAGSDTQVQFNDGGTAFGGDGGLTYDKTNDILTNTHTALGTTSTDGLVLTNTTAAAVGAQQISPRLRLHASGWKTNATAAARNVDWIIENLPVQGAANPDTALKFGFSLNNASYIYPMWYYVGPNNYTMVLRYNADATAPVDTQGTAALEIQSSGVLHFSSTNPAAQIRFVNDTSLGISNTGTTVLDFHAGSVLSLLKLAGAQFTVQLDGQSGRTLGMSRQTTAATAGNSLTVQAGGAKSASTDKTGGNLVLATGLGTGTGSGQILLQTSPAGSSGTSDNALVTQMTINGTGQVLITALKTTGAATGKTVVCVDTTTGQLYASTSGVACAN